jgi:inhibitor of cysteine peptidase
MLFEISSCSQGNKQVAATATRVASTVTVVKKEEEEDNTAHIDQLNILTYDSFPVQSNIIVKGYLANNCVSISDIMESRQDSELQFELVTTRQAGHNCIKKKHNFEEIIPINTEGLKAGFYTVKVNDVTKTFELIVDNIVR